MTKRVAILISGSGSNMVALAKSMTGDHPGRPVLVLSNRPDAGGLIKARDMNIATQVIDHKSFGSRSAFDEALHQALVAARVDVVCLAGFMRIFAPSFTALWSGRMLNIHPALLPRHKGLNTHQKALDAGDTEHGCSVHEVTAELDGGPVLGQARLTIAPDDTAETLATRVLPLEHRLYPAVLRRYLDGDRSRLDLFTDEALP